MTTPTVVELCNVTKSYLGTETALATPVLRGVDLSVGEGAMIAIVGPSGSGKSTLLNIIGGLDRPDSGQVVVDGRDLATLSEDELAAVRAHRIGFVFQLHHLLPQCTVLENVLVPTLAPRPSGGAWRLALGAWRLVPSEAPSAKRQAPPEAPSAKRQAPSAAPELRARRLLERVGLADRLGHRPGQLSGGERQRVAVVRALINEPKLCLADEPTGALDRAAAENLAELLVELNQAEGVALIVVTHSEALAARMSRVLTLEEGKIVSDER